MEITSDGILQRVTGDPFDEMSEATYRSISNQLRRRIRANFIKRIDKFGKPDVAEFWKHPVSESGLGLLIGFVLSAILESLPGSIPLQDQRRRTAYNLRVQSYEEFADILVGFGIEFLGWGTGDLRDEEIGDRAVGEIVKFAKETGADLKAEVQELDKWFQNRGTWWHSSERGQHEGQAGQREKAGDGKRDKERDPDGPATVPRAHRSPKAPQAEVG